MPKVSRFGKFVTKLKNWEYWSFSLLYFPVFFYYGWLAIRARSIFFFTASNPSIDFGGMFGEKKSEIFDIMPKKYLPITKLIQQGDLKHAVLEGRGVGYPLIAKPDVGERGIWIKWLKRRGASWKRSRLPSWLFPIPVITPPCQAVPLDATVVRDATAMWLN